MPSVAKKKRPQTIPIYIRLPKALKKAIEDRAESERRSMTTEIEIAIEKYLAQHGLWPPPEPEAE